MSLFGIDWKKPSRRSKKQKKARKKAMAGRKANKRRLMR